MTVLAFVAQSIGWTVIGFLVGFFAGRAAHDVRRIADAVTTPTPGDTSPPDPAPRRRWRTFDGQTMVAIVVVLLGIVTVVQGFIQSSATERVGRCVAEYSNRFADAIDARSAASTEAQKALDELMSVAAQATDREAVRRALHDYLASRERVKREQRQHPYPDPPRDACR